ncbi:MAG: TonB-dependent receptor [Bacteroidetes bacterium]|nr:TonB-dependent receptor [Bacteroidota bacterium]
MTKRFIPFVLFTAICVVSLAQEASLSGTVYQVDKEWPIVAASVYLEKTTHGASTNGKGAYHMSHITPGTYTLVVSCIGYQKVQRDIELPSGALVVIDIEMVENVSVLAEITVMTGGHTGIKDIPGSAAYVSPKELQRFNYSDINRTLGTVPGINMQEEDGFGLRPNIGLRGTGVDRSAKITLMEDGVLIAPAPYAAPAAYYFPTVGRMQGIEILKGSSQIKYGPYTTGGAINLISTQIPTELAGRFSLSGGSFGGRNLHASMGNAHKNIAYLVETYQYGSQGFKVLDNGGDAGFDKKDYLAKLQVNTNLSARVYQQLTLKVGEMRETANETYLGLTETDFNASPYRRYAASQLDQINTRQRQYTLGHMAKFSDHLRINTTVYRTEFTRNWYKLDKVQDSTGTRTGIADILEDPLKYADAHNILTGQSSTRDNALEMKANNRSYVSQGVQTRLDYRFNTKEIIHDIAIGVRYHHDQVDRYQWVDYYVMDNGVMEHQQAGVPGTESNLIDDATAFATYLEYKMRTGRLTATPGLRYEHITLGRSDYGKSDPGRTGTALAQRSNTVGVLIPGLGLDYRLGTHASTFVGIHQGFAPPGSKEETVPERSMNYELGLRYNKSGLSVQTVAFYNYYHNLLGADMAAGGGGGTGDLFNAGEVKTNGLEVQGSYNLLYPKENGAFALPLSVAYTFTDAVFLTSFDSEFEGWGQVQAGDHFPYLARHQLAVVMGLEHRMGQISLSAKYMDHMRTVPGQGEMLAHEKTDAYLVLDASAQLAIGEKAALFCSGTNLTNEVYVVSRRPAGLRPGMPRAFTLGLRANF